MITYIFWGCTVLSILLALASITAERWKYMIPSLVLYLPFALYLQATPRFQGILALLLCHLIIAFILLKRKRRYIWAAWLAMIPMMAYPAWVFMLVIR